MDLDTGEEIDPGNFELVWSGTGLYERHVLPQRQAEVDAFLIIQGDNSIRFNHRLSTSTQYGMPALYEGKYLLTYLIVAENFDQVEKSFKLEFGGDYEKVNFYAVQ